jgi:hypothetical protein
LTEHGRLLTSFYKTAPLDLILSRTNPVQNIKQYFTPPPNAKAPSGPAPPHYRGSTITLRNNTLVRIPLDERSAQRRDFYLTPQTLTQDTHDPAGFELAIPASKRPQTHALAGAATAIGTSNLLPYLLPNIHHITPGFSDQMFYTFPTSSFQNVLS